MHCNPLTAIDFYKSDHRNQYPKNTTNIYSNLTARSAHLANVTADFDNKIVFFGLQYFIKHFLINTWEQEFFKQEKNLVVQKYQHRMDTSLGKNAISTEHIEALHDLTYLPLKIKALPECARVPIGVPVLTITNTHPDFFWLTNYLETAILSHLWHPIASATTAFQYKKLMMRYARKTGSSLDFVPFQVHDFSFRSMSGIQSAMISGAAHLTSFCGTDTVPAIDVMEDFYCADSSKETIGVSVPATEHSVMCMGTKEGELDTFGNLINNIYPSGIVSIVSDTWDLWKVISEYLPALKNDIMKRNGKVVIRPDSGDPVKIITGDPKSPEGSAQNKGVLLCMWEIFGGTITDKGYRLLDDHIGLIYGDAINLDKATKILEAMEKNSFASSNITLGVGSCSYGRVTRDSFGLAIKATSGIVNGKRRDIFKNPATDSGVKKSAKGLLRVAFENNELKLYDKQTQEQEAQGELSVVFADGKLLKTTSLSEIRQKIDSSISETSPQA